jgi:hypothetical protein
MANQNVTIGRIVRFRGTDGAEWPAIITVVHSETVVSLQVFRFADVVACSSVPFAMPADEPKPPAYWRWPDRG